VTTAACFTLLEITARAYSGLRFGNPAAFGYGWSFLTRLRSGAAALDQGWGAARGGDEAALSRDVAEGVAAQALFDRRDDPNDGLTRVPPRVVTLNSGIPATINSLGFRGPDFPPEPAPGVVRIAMFGGSYVFGAYLRDDQTWAFLTEQQLRKRSRPVEVVNAGVNGANVHGVLTEVIRLSNRLKLHAAVITTAYNNHPLLPITRRYSYARVSDFYLYNLSLFYVMVKEKAATMLRQPLDYGLYRQRVRVLKKDVDWLISLYGKRLQQIATVCRERGITAIFASQPEVFFESTLNEQSTLDQAAVDAITARLVADDSLFIAELEFYLQSRLNLEAQRVAAEFGAPFFDGATVLQSHKKGHFVDQIHPNERGAERIAAALAEFLDPIVQAAYRR
jgi:hypothetical protein